MVVKVYISGISGNQEVKKRQQRVLMILDSKHISYNVVDITEPGKEDEKDFMQTNSTSKGVTIGGDQNPRHPLPPQIYNEEDYCGDYELFDLANEIDTLEQFLKVAPSESKQISQATVEISKPEEKPQTEAVSNGEVATNGIESSREASVEKQIEEAPVEKEMVIDNSSAPATEEAEEEEEEDEISEEEPDETVPVAESLKKAPTDSQLLIESEKSTD